MKKRKMYTLSNSSRWTEDSDESLVLYSHHTRSFAIDIYLIEAEVEFSTSTKLYIH
jgi:hypothetical protein